MLGGLGTFEIVLIVLVILVVFGGSRIPALGKGLGEGLRNFKDAIRGNDKGHPGKNDPDKKTDLNQD